MKLVTFSLNGNKKIGVVKGEGVIDLSELDSSLPGDMLTLLNGGEQSLEAVRNAVEGVEPRLTLSDVELEAPLDNPRKFLAIGMNYEKHAQEADAKGIPRPKEQLWFNKQVSCVAGPFATIDLPKVSEQLDYEAELAFVIGKKCRHVSAENAHEVIAAYTVCNDVSVRDWQLISPTWTIGKSFDTHGPIGPWLVTADEIGDPHKLDVKCFVNGELRQDSNTSDLIHDCFQMVEYLSKAFTLEPGDIIATGTPAGVAIAMNPPTFLKVGDVVRCEVEKIGFIENTVVLEH